MSGPGFQSAARPVEEESNLASESAMIPHHPMVERNAKGNILSLKSATQILVSHTNPWFTSFYLSKNTDRV